MGGRLSVEDLEGAVGVFGGTFDPIHHGHLAVAEAARDALALEQVLFVPAGQPPHKPEAPEASAAARLAMVRLAIAGNPAFAVSTVELDRDGPSYTLDTLRALTEEPGDGLALILSAEAAAGLPGWHEPQAVLDLAALVVVPRDGYPDLDTGFLAGHGLAAAHGVVMLDGPRLRISASEIRARAAAGRSVRYLVPDAVAAFIGDHGLYQDPQRTHRT
jgi:nicotinate-nucleotide adenylyltransferase